MYIGLHVKYTLFFPILKKLEFSRKILEKNNQMSNFMKIRPVAAELFHADGRTDKAQLTVAFRNFANVPKMARIVNIYRGKCSHCKTKLLASVPLSKNIYIHIYKILNSVFSPSKSEKKKKKSFDFQESRHQRFAIGDHNKDVL